MVLSSPLYSTVDVTVPLRLVLNAPPGGDPHQQQDPPPTCLRARVVKASRRESRNGNWFGLRSPQKILLFQSALFRAAMEYPLFLVEPWFRFQICVCNGNTTAREKKCAEELVSYFEGGKPADIAGTGVGALAPACSFSRLNWIVRASLEDCVSPPLSVSPLAFDSLSSLIIDPMWIHSSLFVNVAVVLAVLNVDCAPSVWSTDVDALMRGLASAWKRRLGPDRLQSDSGSSAHLPSAEAGSEPAGASTGADSRRHALLAFALRTEKSIVVQGMSPELESRASDLRRRAAALMHELQLESDVEIVLVCGTNPHRSLVAVVRSPGSEPSEFFSTCDKLERMASVLADKYGKERMKRVKKRVDPEDGPAGLSSSASMQFAQAGNQLTSSSSLTNLSAVGSSSSSSSEWGMVSDVIGNFYLGFFSECRIRFEAATKHYQTAYKILRQIPLLTPPADLSVRFPLADSRETLILWWKSLLFASEVLTLRLVLLSTSLSLSVGHFRDHMRWFLSNQPSPASVSGNPNSALAVFWSWCYRQNRVMAQVLEHRIAVTPGRFEGSPPSPLAAPSSSSPSSPSGHRVSASASWMHLQQVLTATQGHTASSPSLHVPQQSPVLSSSLSQDDMSFLFANPRATPLYYWSCAVECLLRRRQVAVDPEDPQQSLASLEVMERLLASLRTFAPGTGPSGTTYLRHLCLTQLSMVPDLVSAAAGNVSSVVAVLDSVLKELRREGWRPLISKLLRDAIEIDSASASRLPFVLSACFELASRTSSLSIEDRRRYWALFLQTAPRLGQGATLDHRPSRNHSVVVKAAFARTKLFVGSADFKLSVSFESSLLDVVNIGAADPFLSCIDTATAILDFRPASAAMNSFPESSMEVLLHVDTSEHLSPSSHCVVSNSGSPVVPHSRGTLSLRNVAVSFRPETVLGGLRMVWTWYPQECMAAVVASPSKLNVAILRSGVPEEPFPAEESERILFINERVRLKAVFSMEESQSCTGGTISLNGPDLHLLSVCEASPSHPGGPGHVLVRNLPKLDGSKGERFEWEFEASAHSLGSKMLLIHCLYSSETEDKIVHEGACEFMVTSPLWLRTKCLRLTQHSLSERPPASYERGLACFVGHPFVLSLDAELGSGFSFPCPSADALQIESVKLDVNEPFILRNAPADRAVTWAADGPVLRRPSERLSRSFVVEPGRRVGQPGMSSLGTVHFQARRLIHAQPLGSSFVVSFVLPNMSIHERKLVAQLAYHHETEVEGGLDVLLHLHNPWDDALRLLVEIEESDLFSWSGMKKQVVTLEPKDSCAISFVFRPHFCGAHELPNFQVRNAEKKDGLGHELLYASSFEQHSVFIHPQKIPLCNGNAPL